MDKRKLIESEQADSFARRLTAILSVNRRRMASNGVEWVASMAPMAPVAPLASMVAQEAQSGRP